ncbi:3'-5' exonuclease [Flavobacterium sp. WC2509]|uniref:3'-5' exonuclease n=1 Tax=Flavobacterium sp. WC2509 TaxID=3461406 RepID=UPI0040446DBB
MPYYFNLPIITQLTPNQQAALNETDSLALSGGPGTGKSVVCLWRHIRNYETGIRESLLLTYTKTLEHYLIQSALSKNEEAAENVNRSLWWSSHTNLHREYDEIIIDEGQDVNIDIYRTIKRFSSKISYGADPEQSLYLNKEQLAGLTDWLEETFENEEYTLTKNFRNSKEILDFIRSVFPDILIPQDTINGSLTTGLKPIVKITGWNREDELDAIMSIINDFQGDTENIAILVPTQKQVKEYYALIREKLDNDIDCTKFNSDLDEFEGLSGIHITTFKSSKGTEFDTVIIPSFDSYDWYIDKLDVVNEEDYYVALTRTKTNLFLICKTKPNKGNKNTYDIE